MSFAWREYLDIASFLETGTFTFSREAALRCAISRAYFGAFCHARDHARSRHGFVPAYNAGDHELVRLHFQMRGMAGVARNLDSLRTWRNESDYADTVANLPIVLQVALALAREVIAQAP